MPKKRAVSRDYLLVLFKQYMPLVLKIVGGFQKKLPPNVLREDLIAAGMAGLWDALQRDSGKQGERFESYAQIRIRGSIVDELRLGDYLTRRQRIRSRKGDELAPRVVYFDELSEFEQKRAMRELATSEDAVSQAEQLTAVLEQLELLPARDRYIISQLYFKRAKMRELGTELGVSEPRISQIHARAIGKIRANLPGALPPPRKRKR